MSRLTVTNLNFSRGARSILRGVGFEHRQGKILTFLGPSGCGKTTLLWLLAGLIEPASGAICYDGSNGAPSFGMVFQDGGLWEHLSARQHLEAVLRGRGLDRTELNRRVDDALVRSGLSERRSQRPGELSGGERQRLALARALVVRPQWLFLDEPTSQLDGPAREQMVDLLADQLRSTPAGIILATHQVDLAMRLSDELAILQDGAIAQIGPPADIYERPITLAIARLLGPASELPLTSVNDVPFAIRQSPFIIRPQQVRFQPCTSGEARVKSCHFAGGFWQVEAELTRGDRAIVSSPCALPVGTQGLLQWVSG
jgi:ABC-type Fe3+/spermidine/putrescine transport system ATPase subunit